VSLGDRPSVSTAALVTLASTAAMAVVMGLSLMVGQELALLGLAGVGLITMLAVLFPRATLVTYVILGILPEALRSTTLLPATWDVVAAQGVTLGDVVLFGMAVAVVIRLAGRAADKGAGRRLGLAFSSFLAWCILQSLRNLPSYGLAALGEFRLRYLPVVLVAYVVLEFRLPEHRDRLAWWIFALSAAVPVLLLPVIGSAKGWSFGASSRFLFAAVSLGVWYGLLWVYLRWRDGLRIPPWIVVGLVVGLGTVEVLVDGHRSVWLAAAVTVLTLIWLGVFRGGRRWVTVAIAVLLVAVVVGTAWSIGADPGAYVANRVMAFTNPTQDVTSFWRLGVWKAAIESAAGTQPVGLGLGGYWNLYVPELGGVVTVFPHNMYVMTVVKLGLVGLVLWFWLIAEAAVALVSAWRARAGASPDDEVLLAMGLCALTSAVAYQIAYSVAAISLIWLGLGLAAALGSRSSAGHEVGTV
jgi:hypothetical protein